MRLPSVVTCAATLCVRAVNGTSRNCLALLRKTHEGGDALGLGEPERAVDLQLLDVLGEVAAGHALVQVLVTGEFAELLDARLDVVAGDALPPHDGFQVDLVLDPLVALDHAVRHRNAEIALALQHGDPVFALETDLAFAAPDGAHGRRGVAFGEDVRDVILGHGPLIGTARGRLQAAKRVRSE